MQDKLWFFGAFRRARYDKPIANTFILPSGVPVPGRLRSSAWRRGSLRAGHLRREDGQPDRPPDLAGVAAQQVRGVHGPRDAPARPRDGRLTDPAHASVVWHTPTFATGSAKWTSTVSSKLLLESGFSFNRERYDNVYQPGIDRRAQHAGVVRRRAQERQQHAACCWNAPSAQLGNYPDRYNVMAAGVVRHRLAQRQGRLPGLVGPVPPLEHRERRPVPDLQQRRAAAGHAC